MSTMIINGRGQKGSVVVHVSRLSDSKTWKLCVWYHKCMYLKSWGKQSCHTLSWPSGYPAHALPSNWRATFKSDVSIGVASLLGGRSLVKRETVRGRTFASWLCVDVNTIDTTCIRRYIHSIASTLLLLKIQHENNNTAWALPNF